MALRPVTMGQIRESMSLFKVVTDTDSQNGFQNMFPFCGAFLLWNVL